MKPIRTLLLTATVCCAMYTADLHAADGPKSEEISVEKMPVAADIVREVRASEQWIHQIKSLQVTYAIVDKRSDIDIAASTAARKKAGQNIDPKVVWMLRPSVQSSMEFFFDGKRCRMDTKAEDDLYRYERLWDGKAGFSFYHWKIGRPPVLSIDSRGYLSDAFGWLLADEHEFDWMDPHAVRSARPPEEFTTVGREMYRGVDCWKLMTTNNQGRWPTRWFVGVADDRLYGIWEGAAGDPAEQLTMYGEFAAADGVEIKSQSDIETWISNLSKKRQSEVQEQTLEWVGRRGLPACESWLADYVQLRPDIWFPKRYGSQIYSTQKEDSTYGGPVHMDDISEHHAMDVRIDEALPDDAFAVSAMHVPEGTQVLDSNHTPYLDYRFKEKFTPEEWQAILDAADRRQAAMVNAAAAQQRAQAAAQELKAAQEAARNPRPIPAAGVGGQTSP